MVPVNKSGTDQRIPLCNLTLYNVVPRWVQRHSEFKPKSPHPHITKTNFTIMPKAHRKSKGEEEDDVPLHGATNEEEAKIYSSTLDDIVLQMGAGIKDEKVDAMKEVMKKYKEAIANMFPNMATANTDTVWASVKDKVGLCL